MEWKIFVNAAETSNKVVLEGADSPLGSVAAMDTRGCKLEIDSFITQELLEGCRAFVIKALEDRTEARSAKGGMDALVSSKD